LLHNTTRQALIQANRGYAALVIDAAYFMGWETYHVFSRAQIVELLHPLGIATKAVLVALRDPLFEKRGQRNSTFRLPAVSTVRKTVQADREATARDELDQTAFASMHAYRMAVYAMKVENEPGYYTRYQLAKSFGVCKTTTRNYDKKIGHSVRAAYKFHPLSDEDIDKLPINREPPGKYFLLVKHPNGHFFAPLLRGIAQQWRAKNIAVQLIEQVGNLYQPVEGAYAESYAA
jgi:hypothetical protein